MKKIIIFIVLIVGCMTAKAQFPTTDSLRSFINRWIRNSAVESFQNLRLNTALIGMTNYIDSVYGGQVVSFTAPNDSTARLILLGGDTMDVVIRGSALRFGLEDNSATANRTFNANGYNFNIDSVGNWNVFSKSKTSGADRGALTNFGFNTNNTINLWSYIPGSSTRSYGFNAYGALTQMFAAGHVAGHATYVQSDTLQVILEADPNRLYMFHDSVALHNITGGAIDFRIRTLPQTIDTTNFKPLAIGPLGQVKRFTGWAGGGGVSQNIVDTINKYLPTGTIYSNIYYFGPPGEDTTWRIISDTSLIFQRNGVTKFVISIEDDIIVLDSVYFTGSTFKVNGDSYSQAVGASPSSNGYVPLLATNLGMTADNQSESGTGIMDVQFRMYRDDDPFGQENRLPSILLIGFNDYLKSSSGSATQAMFTYAFRAAIFNHFLDTALASNDAGLTTTGSWSTFDLSASYPQKSKYLSGGAGRLSVASSAGASKQYAFDGPNVGIFFLGANGTTQDYGRLKIEIDGVAVDTVDENNIADNQTVFANSGSRTEDLVGAAVVYTGLTSGAHTIKATLLDNKNTNIDAFGVMDLPENSQSMVVGSIQKLLSAGYTAMSGGSPKNNAGVDATNSLIQAVVNEFRSLGYPVVYVDVNSFTDANTDIDTDNIHWDNSGHLAGKNAFRSKIRL